MNEFFSFLTSMFTGRYLPLYEKREGVFLGVPYTEYEESKKYKISIDGTYVLEYWWTGETTFMAETLDWRKLSPAQYKIFMEKLNTEGGRFYTQDYLDRGEYY